MLLFAFCTSFGAATRSADDAGTLLKHNFESAKSALAAGDVSGAERDFKQTIALGLRQLGSLSIAEARYDEAAHELDEALKVEPDNPDIATDAAIAWFHVGDVKKAQQLARSVVAANPRNARAQNVLGRIDLYRADFPAAITDLQAAVALDDDFET
ncbi:MAG TPA: tetratricopeptide repeat protein, partial [Candidatus Sulfotelmatobacter sp.]|nr:tetratricopeptide repeat protein [Candidatus Sulfotelmatobacter sp.]